MTYTEVFVYLQLLDYITTLVGLRLGASELSPFVRWVMHMDPMAGLTLVKLFGLVLGGFCLWIHRPRVIQRVNYIFAAVVLWNLSNILWAVSRAA